MTWFDSKYADKAIIMQYTLLSVSVYNVMILSSSGSTNIYLPSYFLLNHGFGETKSLGNAFNLYATTFFDCNIFAYPWPFRSRLITSKELWVG